LRLGKAIFGRHIRCDGQRSISLRQAEVGERIVRIEVNGLLKKANSCSDFRRNEFVQMITSRQIELIGLDVLGVASGQPILFFSAKSKSKRVCYFLRDRVLNGKNARELFVECARPERSSVRHVYQTRRDTYAIAEFLNVAFENGIDLQLAASCQRILIETDIFPNRSQ